MSYSIRSSRRIAFRIIAAMSVMGPVTAYATSAKPTGEVVVEHPTKLPDAVQKKGDAMHFHQTGVQKYLYIAQDNGKRLVVLDVTDPDETKVAAQLDSFANASYHFVRPMGEDAVLVRFHGSEQQAGYGIVDLQKAKKPTLRPMDSVTTQARVEHIGDTAYFVEQGKAELPTASHSQHLQVVDINSRSAEPVATIQGVQSRLEDRELGRFFLLADDWVWIIRQPAVEESHRIHQFSRMN
jgi:hypothetical protein